MLAVVVLYAGVASLSRPLTDAAAVAVAVPVVAVLAHGIARTPRPSGVTRRRVRRSMVAWATIAALATAWELAAWLQQPAHDVAAFDHPTVSILLDPFTGSGASRFVVWCCWLYAGYRLVRR